MSIKRLVILITLSLLVALTVVMPKANAWTDNLPTCAMPSDWDWSAAVQAKLDNQNNIGQGEMHSTWTDNPYIVGQLANASNSNQYVVLIKGASTSVDDPSHKLTVRYDRTYPSESIIAAPSGGQGLRYDLNFDTDILSVSGTWSGTSDAIDPVTSERIFGRSDSVTSYRFNCIAYAHVSYAEDYSGKTFDGQISVPVTPAPDCSAFDIGCWIGSAFTGVTDTLISVGEAIVEGIALLFIPNESFFITKYNDLYNFFRQKLGFAFYPITFFQEMFENFERECSGGSACSIPKITGGNFLGGTFNIDVALADSTLLSYVRTIIQMVTVITLLFGVHHKYKQVVHK